jgi:hypothetical protein
MKMSQFKPPSERCPTCGSDWRGARRFVRRAGESFACEDWWHEEGPGAPFTLPGPGEGGYALNDEDEAAWRLAHPDASKPWPDG